MARTDTGKRSSNPYVALAGTLGGMLVGCTALVVIFASAQAWILGWIAVALAALGMFLGSRIAAGERRGK